MDKSVFCFGRREPLVTLIELLEGEMARLFSPSLALVLPLCL